MLKEKNLIQASVAEIAKNFQAEIDRLEYCNLHKIGNRSNNNGGLHKCRYMLYLLDAISSDTIITVEGCRGDMDIRDFYLTNTGSVVEALVKAIFDHEQTKNYCKEFDNRKADTKNGFNELEIKASLDSHYKATPAQDNRTVCLINRSGVSIIRKTDIKNCTDSKGRLPATGLFGNRNNFIAAFLERALGIEGGFEEE